MTNKDTVLGFRPCDSCIHRNNCDYLNMAMLGLNNIQTELSLEDGHCSHYTRDDITFPFDKGGAT